MTGKRVFVVGPVFLGPISSQTAMTLDPDGQALAPARPRCRHFFALESSRCLLLKLLLLLLGADLIRMHLVRLDRSATVACCKALRLHPRFDPQNLTCVM
jgi:hypothetical protein